jgi:hypothetical protein
MCKLMFLLFRVIIKRTATHETSRITTDLFTRTMQGFFVFVVCEMKNGERRANGVAL